MLSLTPMTSSSDAGPALTAAGGVLTIDLSALADNWRRLAERVAPAECAGVIKANAYGTGLEPAARALFAAGCRTFFVAQVAEGVRARAALGAAARIFVLNGLQARAEPADYVAHRLAPILGSPEELARWAPFAADGPACAIHLDTGMSRLGFASLDALEAALAGYDHSRIALIMSHFVSSEEQGDPLNDRQIALFDKARALLPGVPASLANSSGIFLAGRPFYDLVRPGYALYGGNPTPATPNPMRSVVRLEARIQQVRQIEPGASVGYNAQWMAKRSTRLATLLIGYADGLPRSAGATDQRSGADVIIAGRRCPLVGRVSMDLCVADVTDIPESAPRPGDSAVILGEEISVDELGARAGTIGYQILTSLGARYRREYIPFSPQSGEKVARSAG
ncbi:MAG TPA: alanine racemase [Roseiarcus sp.]|nr:alanine racemase [Roseiarcus sp.]